MREIQLTQGQVALVDDDDYERLAKHKWHAAWRESSRTYYAVRARLRRSEGHGGVYMHRELTGADRTEKVDHINHNGLDNRRENLRLCTHKDNIRNMRKDKAHGYSSRYKGVSWFGLRSKWRAYIVVLGKQRSLGLFERESDAAKAYNEAARAAFGEFALLNNIETETP